MSKTAADQWMEVELFRIARGRLPTGSEDQITESLCKEVMDRAILKGEKIAHEVVDYAAHRWWLFKHPEHHCSEKCKDHK